MTNQIKPFSTLEANSSTYFTASFCAGILSQKDILKSSLQPAKV